MVLCPDRLVLPEHLMFDDWLEALSSQPAVSPAGVAGLSQPMSAQAVSATPLAALNPPLPPAQIEIAAGVAAGQTALQDPVSQADGQASLQTLGQAPAQTPVPLHAPATVAAPDLHSAARQTEHQIIMATLASTPSKLEAARRLGISPRTLRYKLAQMRDGGLNLQAA